jgi:hypothetical protein
MSSPSPSSVGETEPLESSIPRTTCIYISHDHVDIANPIHHDDSMINRWSEGSETRITTNCALLGCYPLRERCHCRHPFVAADGSRVKSWVKSGKRSIIWKLRLRMTIESNPRRGTWRIIPRLINATSNWGLFMFSCRITTKAGTC